MNNKIIKYIENNWIRNLFFLLISLIIFLPFLINGELITWIDYLFHITRIHEVILEQQHGQLFPDIVQYSGVQNWGYGLNFFYSTYPLLPLVILWRVLDNPVLAFIIFDIFIVYFSLAMNYHVMKKASNHSLRSFLFTLIYVLTASAGTGLSYNIPVVRLALLTQFTSNIAFLFAPVILISFYQIIFNNKRSFWLIASIFSSLSVMLSIPTTLGLIIVILIMFIVGLCKKSIDIKSIYVLLFMAVTTLLLSAIFIFPFLEQRLGSTWAPLPNSPTLWGMSFFDRVVKKIFDFSDILSLLVLLIFILLLIQKKLSRTYGYIVLSYVLSLILLYSTVFPWYFVQGALSGALQMTYRWDFIPHIIGSYFVARGLIELLSTMPKLFPLVTSATFIFAVLGMYGNTISTYFPVINPKQVGETKPEHGITNESFYATTGNILYSVPHRVNSKNISVILNSNFATREELGVPAEDPNWSSLAFNDYRLEGQYKNHRSVYANSLVKYDNKLYGNITSAQGEDFYINNIPSTVNKVQSPITYLKGFKAFNDSGEALVSYKNSDGFLEIQSNGTNRVKITYEKTFLHKISIVISMIAWLSLIFGIISHQIIKLNKGKKREKIVNRRSSLQRRRNA